MRLLQFNRQYSFKYVTKRSASRRRWRNTKLSIEMEKMQCSNLADGEPATAADYLTAISLSQLPSHSGRAVAVAAPADSTASPLTRIRQEFKCLPFPKRDVINSCRTPSTTSELRAFYEKTNSILSWPILLRLPRRGVSVQWQST